MDRFVWENMKHNISCIFSEISRCFVSNRLSCGRDWLDLRRILVFDEEGKIKPTHMICFRSRAKAQSFKRASLPKNNPKSLFTF